MAISFGISFGCAHGPNPKLLGQTPGPIKYTRQRCLVAMIVVGIQCACLTEKHATLTAS